MSIFPKMIYTPDAIPIKIPPAVFAKFKKDDPKIYVQMQETSNSQVNVVWEKKKFKGFTRPNFKTHHKVTVIWTVVDMHINRVTLRVQKKQDAVKEEERKGGRINSAAKA